MQIVQPETLLRWHRAGFRLYWRIKSHGRQPSRRLDHDTVALIQRLARETGCGVPNVSAASC